MIGTKLKELRTKKGVTISQLCDELQMNQNTYAKYERNERDVSTETLSKLADFYGVTTDYLLGREPAPNPFADLGLDEASEQEMLRQYMSFKPEVRAMLMDVLIKLADSAKPEDSPPEIVETTTIGAELDRRAAAASDAEAEETAV